MTTKKDDKFFYIETYDGGSTPLIHVSDHNMQFFCGFDWISLYPMEIETCSFYFYFKGPANFLTKIDITKLEAPIGKFIERYLITEWKIITDYTYSRSEKKMVKVAVTLTMNSLSILLVTYLPTLLMNIINQATNYITGDSKYDLIITVNITSMVVLATIYLSVFTSLPSTAEIKPVEYWLFVTLAYPFLVIITNVVLQVGQVIVVYNHTISLLTNKYMLQAFDSENKNLMNQSSLKIHPARKSEGNKRMIQKGKVFVLFNFIATYVNPALYLTLIFVYAFVYAF